MSLEHYYRDELTWLRLQGRQFADAHPELSRFLSEQTTDPDVERLLEGFAFLTGSLRAKIEDEFPELTHGLLNMLWPNYLRPVPSMAIIQFTPIAGALAQPAFLGRGCALDSIVHNETVCHFQTCHDLWIFPATLENVSAYSGTDVSAITLEMTLQVPMTLEQLDLSKLRFYLGGDAWTSRELYFWLSDRLAWIELEIDGSRFRQPASLLRTSGFAREEALLPYPGNIYSGYRILQEYFCFPESFLFFHLAGGDWPKQPMAVSSFKLHFCFERPLPPSLKIRKDAFMLNCVPAINLFRHDSEPVALTGQQTEYPLRASYSHPDSYEIFSVNNVEGWVEGPDGRARGGTRVYQPFESFQHQIERANGRLALYYRLRVREAVNGEGFEHSLSFVRGDEREVVGKDEAVSVTMTCTNRERAAQLKVGDICVPTNATPNVFTFRNITRPTRSLRPVLDGSLQWMLISSLSLNYVSLLSPDALTQVLRTWDFPALYDKQAEQASRKRLEGIERIETVPVDRLIRGMPVRGLKSRLFVRQSAFAGEGELYLFSTVLAHFLSLYASVNAFHLLEVYNLDNKECYRWPVQAGQHSMM
ncbi:TPA: type VI secretion system baseplate subunit TssF [Serratia marcescens]|uniref:Type VI secretion system baseplate subunit TssF n=2 Tax=Serratia TaxID=613 RepID=A0A9X9BXA4_9GAMM|nr:MULTISPECIES: type VI secretion system baseplate subunit TssF [Serratia]MBS3894570.1 type VI secretion system baseplate subunit TssF [Serratia marcescens]TXE21958.1 type VI secretion system baseplate subunit TssF [Serratia ureilytica]HBC7422213.1 type VI secretion system baseplate subunit TssF [Serratia marcescens]